MLQERGRYLARNETDGERHCEYRQRDADGFHGDISISLACKPLCRRSR